MNQSKPYVYGQSFGKDSYKAPNNYQQTGPRVAGHQRYDNYPPGGNYQYAPPQKEHSSCLQKCCACLGCLACCACLCDCLT